MAPPKLFFSYSWTDQKHIDWVIDLATQLCESGIDVVLDKWALREGQDSAAFMEKMVNDPTIKKVAMIVDPVYSEKANLRSGGVGTEAQIISREVYENQDQNKFVAVIAIRDDGVIRVPTYYGSRVYIDLSVEETKSDGLEQLIRWVFDKPIHKKPEIGNTPAFLDDDSIQLGTTSFFLRASDALKNGKPIAVGAVTDYLDVFTTNLKRFRVEPSDEELDETIIHSIDNFAPYSAEYIKLIKLISKYSMNEDYAQQLQRFFEGLIPYKFKPKDVDRWSPAALDNFGYIIHELLLNTISVLLENEHFLTINSLLSRQYYYLENNFETESRMRDYTIFNNSLSSFDYRGKRLGLKPIYIHGDILKKRCDKLGVEFRRLMQADFVLFLRSELNISDPQRHWWPVTMVFCDEDFGPFEIFARSMSGSYFEKMKCILGTNVMNTLLAVCKEFDSGRRSIPSGSFSSPDIRKLLATDSLCTKP